MAQSSGFVNIRRDVDDKFYRYRMPVMLAKVEGKGNGIKTVIPNMSDVAKALSRPPTYTTKFFGCELGATTILDEKNDRYIVNGAHEARRLSELLDIFIDKFVLCGACKNPETDLIIINKGDDIIKDCKACGQQTPVDLRHKLCAYIFKNPPAIKKKKKATTDSSKNKSEEDTPDGEQDDDELAKRLKAEAAELPSVEKSALASEDWSGATDGATVSKRMGDLALDSDEENADDPYEKLAMWIETERDSITPQSLLEKISDLDIKERHKTVQIIGQSLFTDKILEGEIDKYLKVFQELVVNHEQDKKEKQQKALLGGMERLVGVNYPNMITQIPKILMAWYQADILEEDVIKAWGTHVSKKYVDRDTSKSVRKASEPFLKWLDEAEDDEEEEDE